MNMGEVRYMICWEPTLGLPFHLGLRVPASPLPMVPQGENEAVWCGGLATDEEPRLVVRPACVILDQSASLVLSKL